MNIINDPNLWVICGLCFVLGILVGMFLTAGGRRKWKARYRDEVDTRESWQRQHANLQKDLDEREKEWRERDSLRGAAVKSGPRDLEEERRIEERRVAERRGDKPAV
jgi:hypothetical protein